MKLTLTLIALLASTATANAHIGHLGEVAGHGHWLALGALGIAIGLAGWTALNGKKDDDEAEVEEDLEPQEA